MDARDQWQVALPVVNEEGYYEIRLESIGGLGANLCGKLFGELGAIYLGLNAASFSSYGSEKRGSPVKAFIRWARADEEIRLSSPVETPHLLGLFHEAMAGKLPVTAGVTEDAVVVMNTDATPQQARALLKLHAGTLYCVDALKIAMESRTKLNMVMFGALVRAAGFIPLEAALRLIEDTLGKKYPALLEQNLTGVRRGYEECVCAAFEDDGKYTPAPYREASGALGYANAPRGGVIEQFGSTVANDLSASREGYIPLFLPEKCIHCGLCDSTCPDMVFQFQQGEFKGKAAMVNTGLDYHHCKGCLRCVSVCPTGALVAGKEREHPEKKFFVPNLDLITKDFAFESAGANAWVTSESYLEEKRIDGGLK